MDRIFGASPSPSVVFPPVAKPRQKIVVKRINADSSEVESPTKLMKRSPGTVSGDLRNAGFPKLPEFRLLGS